MAMFGGYWAIKKRPTDQEMKRPKSNRNEWSFTMHTFDSRLSTAYAWNVCNISVNTPHYIEIHQDFVEADRRQLSLIKLFATYHFDNSITALLPIWLHQSQQRSELFFVDTKRFRTTVECKMFTLNVVFMWFSYNTNKKVRMYGGKRVRCVSSLIWKYMEHKVPRTHCRTYATPQICIHILG